MKRPNSKPSARSADATDAAIGSRIRARRLEIGMTQVELADAIGVTFQQIQKYEQGINRVAASTLLDVATALRASVISLLPQTSKPADQTDSALQELSEVYANLNDAGRKLLLETARTFDGHPRMRRPRRD